MTLNVQQAATVLGVSPSSVRRWADRGLLACWRTPGGGHRRFQADELLRLAASRDELTNHVKE